MNRNFREPLVLSAAGGAQGGGAALTDTGQRVLAGFRAMGAAAAAAAKSMADNLAKDLRAADD